MSSKSLLQFQFERATLAIQSLKHYKNLLLGVGNYFHETLGSDIDSQYVLETEKLLNDIYLKVSREGSKRGLQDMIAQATSLSSYLSYAIKNNAIDNKFFLSAKQLGTTLIAMSKSLPK